MAEYGQHTSCVSEAEKYEKTLYKAKTNVKMNPQEAWMELIAEAATRKQEAPANISEHLGRLSELDNVPRNCNKFTNFAKNSLRLNNNSIVDGIWKFLERLKNEKAQLSAVTTVSNDEKKAEKDGSGISKDDSGHQEGKGEKRKVEETQQREMAPDSTDDDAADRKKRKREKKQKNLDRLAAEEAAAAAEATETKEHASADVVAENREKKSKKHKREKIDTTEEETEEPVEENDKKKKKKSKKEKKQED